ncbi:polyprenyl synthetase family protein [OCS116 cluster bacterium]|nr:polyprenyl synthetase family protein [OCS116 cluster bacterium]
MSQFLDHLKPFAIELDGFLKDLLDKKINIDNELKDSIIYSSIGSGKRIRGYLSCEIANFFHADKSNALKLASAIELIHTYSLIHDDLPALDNDDYRRNKPSNHKQFSESTAILSGDALQSLAFEILSDKMEKIDTNKQLKLINHLANNIGPNGMIGGQIIDINSKENQLSIDEVNVMHNLKTANLFSFSCQSGAIIGNANDKEVDAFENYGRNFGIVFQIIDDVLDKIGDPENIGKTLGKDEINKNKTYLNFYSIEECSGWIGRTNLWEIRLRLRISNNEYKCS